MHLDGLVPLYLRACAVEGKTERTVMSYAETLRQFRRAWAEVGLPEDVALFSPAHVYLLMGWVEDRGVGLVPTAGQVCLLFCLVQRLDELEVWWNRALRRSGGVRHPHGLSQTSP